MAKFERPEIATDQTPIWFGKFEGTDLEEVPAWYLLGLTNPDPVLARYINENRDALEKEIEETKNTKYKTGGGSVDGFGFYSIVGFLLMFDNLTKEQQLGVIFVVVVAVFGFVVYQNYRKAKKDGL